MIIDLKELSISDLQILLGPNDNYLKEIEKYYHLSITLCDQQFIFPENKEVEKLLYKLIDYVSTNHCLELWEVQLFMHNQCELLNTDRDLQLGYTLRGQKIKVKTLGQYYFVLAMQKNTVVISTGPAGSGKTFLAVAKAVSALRNHEVERIILTRPAVEAGESLGFLPGDLKEKVDPYLTPLYDALSNMLGLEQMAKYLANGNIEIAPLAYMRGRTLHNAYIILDEAQNTSIAQMKMFLTRLGFHSKMIISGDISQIDLKEYISSGLVDAVQRLQGIDDIAIIKMSEKDIVRHALVRSIIKAYADV